MPPRWPWPRLALWVVLFLLALLIYARAYVGAFRPPDGFVTDFIQEWLSAKNHFAGEPIYAPQRASIVKYVPADPARAAGMLPWNAHPPASVLVALPFGLLDYTAAQLAWNLLSLPFFLAALALMIRELRMPWRWESLLPAAALFLACHPIYYQITQGQFNFLLAFLFVLAWVLEKRGYGPAAGAALGVAVAIKLFPAFLLAYFLVRRRWRALGVAVAVAMLGNLAALGVFGADAFRAYANDVLPSLTFYQSSWANASLTGFVLRIFHPDPAHQITPLFASPLAASVGVHAVRLLVACVSVASAWRWRKDADRAFAVLVAGMLLACPITWAHYFILLLQPLGVLWMRLHGPARWLFRVVLVVMWLPQYYFPTLMLGRERGAAWTVHQHDAYVTAPENLYAASLLNYALLGAFLLLFAANPGRPAVVRGRAAP